VNGTSFERVDLPASPITDGYGIAAIDYDNDGWVDLAAVGNGANGGVLQVLRNVQGHFEDVSPKVGASAVAFKNPRALLVGDLDQDNDADLVVTQAQGPAILLRNDGGNANHAIRVALTGLADNRSGVGTKVEVQAGATWQKFETVSASGFLGQSSPEILAGIGLATEADVVRLLWPTGVVQDEVQLAAGKRHAITEVDRRGSSCPILFTWNGSTFEFVSDAIGPAVIGHWIAPGQYSTPDTDEFVKVDGSKLRARGGRLSLHFIEPMEEINYLDEVRLYAVDHPDGTEIYPNEYFAADPPFPADRTIATRNARLPQGAWDEKGRDLMPALRAADRRFVDTFADAPFKGFAALHALELDLGALKAGAPLRLLMRGFTDYFTATSMYAADQAKVKVIVPYVEAQRADGSWMRVSDDIGFPAGLLRTMVADLTGKLPPGTQRIRIWTNLKIYWDQVLIDTTPDGAIPVTRTEVPLVAASLSRRGYPREIPGTPAADKSRLQRRQPDEPLHGTAATARSSATSRRCLGSEDHFVIFGSGEDVAVDFDATTLPPVKPGWTRDYEISEWLREGHGLLGRVRADGHAAPVQGDAVVSISIRYRVSGSKSRIPARVEHARSHRRGSGQLPVPVPWGHWGQSPTSTLIGDCPQHAHDRFGPAPPSPLGRHLRLLPAVHRLGTPAGPGRTLRDRPVPGGAHPADDAGAPRGLQAGGTRPDRRRPRAARRPRLDVRAAGSRPPRARARARRAAARVAGRVGLLHRRAESLGFFLDPRKGLASWPRRLVRRV
jgi:hypothetical protein